MRRTNLTATRHACIMPYSNGLAVEHIRTRKYATKQIGLAVLYKSPKRIGAQVSNLNHSGQVTVDKKWRFNDTINRRPESSILMKLPHHVGVFLRDTLIIVVNKQAECARAILRFAQVLLKS